MISSIIYIVPYFGKLPEFFHLWLNSCRRNPTVNWLIFTDDKRIFDYPDNVRVVYTTLTDIKELAETRLGYRINLDKPYKLCDLRVAYGYIFQNYIQNYDFWGFCDIDEIFGDIRAFYTEDVLSKYAKIGWQGHSTLIRNTPYYNLLYSIKFLDYDYQKLLEDPKNRFADEEFFNELFDKYLKEPYYRETVFANLSSFFPNFFITYLPKKDKVKNKSFIFSYEDGKLYRLSVVKNKIVKDPFMYVHFLKRGMKIEIETTSCRYLIIPNRIIPFSEQVDVKFIKRANKKHMLRFIITHFKENAYKLNRKTILPILKAKIRGYYKLLLK